MSATINKSNIITFERFKGKQILNSRGLNTLEAEMLLSVIRNFNISRKKPFAEPIGEMHQRKKIAEIFNGKIDDIGLWNRALSQQEITNLYTSVNVGINEPLIENPFFIYPNPTSDQLKVKINAGMVCST